MLHRSRMQYRSMGCHVCHVLPFAPGHILRVSSMGQITICCCISRVAPAIFDASIWGLVWTEYRCYEVSPDLWAGRHWTGTVRYRACIRGRLVRANTRYDSPWKTHISFNTYIYMLRWTNKVTEHTITCRCFDTYILLRHYRNKGTAGRMHRTPYGV
jgi:hypothetical protein